MTAIFPVFRVLSDIAKTPPIRHVLRKGDRMKVQLHVVCALVCLAAASAEAADLIITNAKVFTGASGRQLAEAVAITGDRISFVGSAADLI